MTNRDQIRVWMSAVLEATGWSAAEWARKAGTAPSNITRMLAKEDAPMPRVETLLKLAAAVPARVRVRTPLGLGDVGSDTSDIHPAPGRLDDGIIMLDDAEFVSIPRYDASLSAGLGSILDPHADPLGHYVIDIQWLRVVTRAMPGDLAVLKVDGDSMEPTLSNGDWVLIDRTQTRITREGIYALRVGDAAWVKRITLNLRDQLVRVISDNATYPVQDLEEDQLSVLGRVVWIVARRV